MWKYNSTRNQLTQLIAWSTQIVLQMIQDDLFLIHTNWVKLKSNQTDPFAKSTTSRMGH